MEKRNSYENDKELPLLTHKRSWRQRTFGPIAPGSIRGSVFTLSSSAIGAGALALPFAVFNLGIIFGTATILAAGVLALLGLNIISKAANQMDVYTYSEILLRLYGKPYAFAVELVVIIGTMGGTLAYVILVGDMVPLIIAQLGICQAFEYQRELVILITVGVVVIPLSMFRRLSGLRFTSIMAIVTIVFIALIVVAEFPLYYSDYQLEGLKYFDVNMEFFPAFCICIYAYQCHCNMPQILGELIDRSHRRMKKVNTRSIGLQVIFYITLAVFGYLSMPNNTSSVVLDRVPASGFPNDWAMLAGRLMMTVSLALAIPLNVHPCRKNIAGIIGRIQGKQEEEEMSKTAFYLITAFLIVTITILALVLPDVIKVFSFCGGFSSAIICILVPAMIYIKIERNQMKKIMVMSSAIVLTGFGFASVGLSLLRCDDVCTES